MRYLLGLLFLAAGFNHFRDPDFYVKIIPPYLPWHIELVYISGVIEMLLGLLVLVPKYRVLAAWGLIALLIAIFPANLHMALHPENYPDIPPYVLWLRLPLQALLIGWAYWFTKREANLAA